MQLQRFLKGNLCAHEWRFPRTTEHEVLHLLLENIKLLTLPKVKEIVNQQMETLLTITLDRLL